MSFWTVLSVVTDIDDVVLVCVLHVVLEIVFDALRNLGNKNLKVSKAAARLGVRLSMRLVVCNRNVFALPTSPKSLIGSPRALRRLD